jgi:hypothetical protein
MLSHLQSAYDVNLSNGFHKEGTPFAHPIVPTGSPLLHASINSIVNYVFKWEEDWIDTPRRVANIA